MNDIVADIRAFNRFYTGQIGLLDEHFADGPLSLAEARVLYEIDARGHTTARELIKALGIDRGYLSRMLRKFADADLTAWSPTIGDRRSNQIALTADGDIIVERLDEKSNAAVEQMIYPLTERSVGPTSRPRCGPYGACSATMYPRRRSSSARIGSASSAG